MVKGNHLKVKYNKFKSYRMLKKEKKKVFDLYIF